MVQACIVPNMSDGQIVTCTSIPTTNRKMAVAQDHVAAGSMIGRAALGNRTRIVKEVQRSDGSRVLEEFGGVDPTQPVDSAIDSIAQVVTPLAVTYTRAEHQPQQKPVQKAGESSVAGKQLAMWALAQDSKKSDTPWDAIKTFLGEPPYLDQYRAPRIKVQMTGGGLGKVTLFVSTFAASDTLVLIGFPLDGQSSIIEPPSATSESPITLVCDKKTYTCISGGWSVEVHDQLLVALPICTPETA